MCNKLKTILSKFSHFHYLQQYMNHTEFVDLTVFDIIYHWNATQSHLDNIMMQIIMVHVLRPHANWTLFGKSGPDEHTLLVTPTAQIFFSNLFID